LPDERLLMGSWLRTRSGPVALRHDLFDKKKGNEAQRFGKPLIEGKDRS